MIETQLKWKIDQKFGGTDYPRCVVEEKSSKSEPRLVENKQTQTLVEPESTHHHFAPKTLEHKNQPTYTPPPSNRIKPHKSPIHRTAAINPRISSDTPRPILQEHDQ